MRVGGRRYRRPAPHKCRNSAALGQGHPGTAARLVPRHDRSEDANLVLGTRVWVGRLLSVPIGGLVVSGVAAAAVPAEALEIAPHRAIYDVRLSQLRSGTAVSDVDGQMLFQWADACDAWIVDQRYQLDFVYQEGQTVEVNTSYTTWETKDGLAFTFNLRRTSNGTVEEELRGKATLDDDGEGGVADFRLPDEHAQDLPAGTLFPTAHTIELIDRAMAGDPFFLATLFDGSEAEGLVELSAVIGDLQEADEDAEDPLLAGPSWSVQMAFFALAQESATPDYEISVRLYANGVIDEMLIDYGDFVMVAELALLEPMEASGC